MGKLLERLLDLLFPPKCPFCRRPLAERDGFLCPKCQRELPWIGGTGRERAVELTEGCVSVLYYRDSVRESVHRFKFQNCSGYHGVYGRLMAQAVQAAWPDVRFDAVTWTPLSKKRKRERGYDQAELLAETVGKALSLPVCPALLKTRHTPAQSKQTDLGRRKVNVMNVYALCPGFDPAGKTILLCDDVVTTGSTLSECAKILRMAGAEKVYAVTLARAGK